MEVREIHNLTEGTEFRSCEEFFDAVKNYEKFAGVSFNIGNSSKQGEVCEKFSYESVTMKCQRAGNFVPRENNVRKTKSRKCGCLAVIKANVKNGKFCITTLNLQHNHEINEQSCQNQRTTETESNNEDKLQCTSETENNVSYNYGIDPINDLKTLSENERHTNETKKNKSCYEGINLINNSKTLSKNDLVSFVTNTETHMESMRVVNEIETSEVLTKSQDEIEVIVSEFRDFMYHLPENKIEENIMTVKDMIGKIKEQIKSEEVVYENIKMPAIVKSIGRPKGTSKQTVIGLDNTISKQFILQKQSQQIHLMFEWMDLKKNILKNTLTKEYLLQMKDFDNVDEIIQPFLNDKVQFELLKIYMEKNSFEEFKLKIDKYRREDNFVCASCNAKILSASIECDHCMTWIDYECAGFSSDQEVEIWFCKKCEMKFAKDFRYV